MHLVSFFLPFDPIRRTNQPMLSPDELTMTRLAALSIRAELAAVDAGERDFDAAQSNIHKLVRALMAPRLFCRARAQALIRQLKSRLSIDELLYRSDSSIMNAGRMASVMYTLVELHKDEERRASVLDSHTSINTAERRRKKSQVDSVAQRAVDELSIGPRRPASASTSSSESVESRLPRPADALAGCDTPPVNAMRKLTSGAGRFMGRCLKPAVTPDSSEVSTIPPSSDSTPKTRRASLTEEENVVARGQALINERKWPEAVSVLEWLIDNHPDNAEYASLCGKCYLAVGRFEKSFKIHRAALEVFGDTPERLRNVIEALMHLNRGDEAYAYRVRLRKLESADDLNEVGATLDEEQRSALARRNALYAEVVQSRRALAQHDERLSPTEVRIKHAHRLHVYGAYLSSTKRNAEAIGYLEQAVAYDPFNATYLTSIKQTEQRLATEPSDTTTHTANQRFQGALFQ